MPFKTLSKIFVTVALSTTLLGCASANPKQYEGVHNKFVPVGRMVAKRSSHHGILLPNGEVALLGGAGKPYEQTVENYDPETGQFRLTGKLMIARRETTATLLQNGKILITGGSGGYSDCHNENELYDPATGKSRLTGKLNQCRSNHQATLLQNGKVLITGGRIGFNSEEERRQSLLRKQESVLALAELYDPETETFKLLTNMKDRRTAHNAILLQDGNVLLTGGCNQGSLDSTELYLTKENQFIKLPRMHYSRMGHQTILLSNGMVLLVGGQEKNQKTDLEKFNHITKKFEDAGFLTLESTGFHNNTYGVTQAVLLPSGEVLVLFTKQTQIYNPKTKTAVKGPDRLYKWGGYSAVKLTNGDILITQGYNIESFLEPIELYKF